MSLYFLRKWQRMAKLDPEFSEIRRFSQVVGLRQTLIDLPRIGCVCVSPNVKSWETVLPRSPGFFWAEVTEAVK